MNYLTAYPLYVQERSPFITLWGSWTLQSVCTLPLNTSHLPLTTVASYTQTTSARVTLSVNSQLIRTPLLTGSFLSLSWRAVTWEVGQVRRNWAEICEAAPLWQLHKIQTTMDWFYLSQQERHSSIKCPGNSDSEPACTITGTPLSGMQQSLIHLSFLLFQSVCWATSLFSLVFEW